MNRIVKIALFVVLSTVAIAAEQQFCCGWPSCIPGVTCPVK